MKSKLIKVIIATFILSSGLFLTPKALNLDYIAGKNRYETAAMISSKMNYNTAILVNGLALVDGLSASGLSGALNAPILLTDKNSIPDVTLSRINSTHTIYLVGGNGVISPSIEQKLKSMGKEVIRLGGSDRYLTSHVVANEIERIKGIQELYYVNGLTGQADAMSIAPVAASTGNPVILTNGQVPGYSRNVFSYSIGGTGVLSLSFDAFTQRFDGKNRFETNKKVIERFFPNRTHVNLSKSLELIDALTASALKEPVVLIDDTSDKTPIAGSHSATVFGNISQVAVSRAKSYIYGEKVVFYVQHQDDETIFAGSAIVDAIASVGSDNVYIVLVTEGENTGVFLQDRYKNLTEKEKTTLRNNEFLAAIERLGINKNNIVFLNQPENNIDNTVIINKVLEFENNFDNVSHIAHSYKNDIHPQHLKTGTLVYDLYKKGLIKDVRFFGRKTYDNQKSNLLIESVSDNELEKQKVLNACEEYKLDNKDMVREGIGFKSVSSLFLPLMNSSNVPSYLHEPDPIN
ncbi:hypothetical protein JCM1393_06240 [Clostridium carnis]